MDKELIAALCIIVVFLAACAVDAFLIDDDRESLGVERKDHGVE